jgi:hypothetical protein
MAKILDAFDQGSAEWYAARLGIPTSSNFDKIITPAKGDFSKSARAYAYYLAAEAILRTPLESISHLEWVGRGKEMEPLAVKQYAFTEDAAVRTVGFITTDDGQIGCSPDRLVDVQDSAGRWLRGGLEVKCPAPQTHIAYLVDGPGDNYKPQVQGQLYVAELDFVDFYSFHPSMPPVLRRTYRDEPYIAKLAAALRQFCDMKQEILALCRKVGFFAASDHVATPIDQLHYGK